MALELTRTTIADDAYPNSYRQCVKGHAWATPNTFYYTHSAFKHGADNMAGTWASLVWPSIESSWDPDAAYCSLNLTHSPFRFPELDRVHFGADDVQSASATVRVNSITHYDVTNTYALEDDENTDAVRSIYISSLDQWWNFTQEATAVTTAAVSLCLSGVKADGASLYSYPVSTSGAASSLTGGESITFDITDYIKAYLTNAAQVHFFDHFFIPSTGVEIDPNDAGSEAALETLLNATSTWGISWQTEGLQKIPTGTTSYEYVEWTNLAFSAARVKFKGGYDLDLSSRVFYGTPPAISG